MDTQIEDVVVVVVVKGAGGVGEGAGELGGRRDGAGGGEDERR